MRAVNNGVWLRVAEGEEDVEYLYGLSVRVQDWLVASGSLQELGPIPREVLRQVVGAGEAHVLWAEGGERVGGVLLERVDGERFGEYKEWDLVDDGGKMWFLSKLMVEPSRQGQGLGMRILEGVKAYVLEQGDCGRVVLDCWAGNEKLRRFYGEAGFKLHGVFAGEGDYEVAVFVWEGE